MTNPSLLSPSVKRFGALLALFAIDGLVAVLWLVSIPADPKNSVLWGFSAQRLVLLGVALAGMAIFAALSAAARRQPARAHRALRGLTQAPGWGLALGALLALAVLGWLAVFLPGYWFQTNQAYFDRLRPLLAWGGLIGAQGALGLLALQPGFSVKHLRLALRADRRVLWAGGAALAAMLLVWAFVAWSGVGLKPDHWHWNVAGVPLLGVQVGGALIVALALPGLFERWFQRRAGVALALLVYAFTLALWIGQPMPASYFAPGPYPPNYEFFPYSDAAIHDLGGQYWLIGKGVFNMQFTDKPLYMLFLGLIHWAVGQDYTASVALQTVVLGVFPVLLFFFGRSLLNSKLGLFLALLSIFKERNAIASTLEIRVSHTRLMMTEFPTALGVLIFTWLTFEWLKDPQGKRWYPLYAGGALGLAALVRPNPLLIAPAALLLALVALRRKPLQWFLSACMMGAMTLLMLLPWNLATRSADGQPYLWIKIQDVIKTRYRAPTPTPTPEATPEARAPRTIGKLAALTPQDSGPDEVERIPQDAGFLTFGPAHFLHNEITALLILPHSFILDDLQHTLDAPYYEEPQVWNGALPPEKLFWIFVNLALMALGLGVLWTRWRWAALLPLAANLAYFAANAFARTSGARYLVPVDWTLLLYYAAGVTQAAAWVWAFLRRAEKPAAFEPAVRPAAFGWPQGVLLAAMTGAAFFLPYSGGLFPRRYTPESTATVLQDVIENHATELAWAGLTPQEVQAFASAPGARVLYGRGLYPHSYGANQTTDVELRDLPPPAGELYPRLILTVVADRVETLVMPLKDEPWTFPSGADILAIGCDAPQRFQAAVLVALDEQGNPERVWARYPSAPAACPLPEPVCDASGNCR